MFITERWISKLWCIQSVKAHMAMSMNKLYLQKCGWFSIHNAEQKEPNTKHSYSTFTWSSSTRNTHFFCSKSGWRLLSGGTWWLVTILRFFRECWKHCLLIWVLATWVCSVCENYQPASMWSVHFSVHMSHFNNNHFLKSRWRKRTQWKSLVRMS